MNWRLFWHGWKRRNMAMLDAAGCPVWLQRWRCPTLNDWGAVLSALNEFGFLYLRSGYARAAASYALKLDALHALTSIDKHLLDGYLHRAAQSSVKPINQLMDEALRCAKTGDTAWLVQFKAMMDE